MTVTGAPVNDAPVANPDSYNAIEDTLLAVAADQGVLFNDDDDAHAGTTLTATPTTTPTSTRLPTTANTMIRRRVKRRGESSGSSSGASPMD